MKARTAILIALAACLLLDSVALRQAQGSALAQSSGPPSPAQYVVVQGAASGGHYRLASQALRQAAVVSPPNHQDDTWLARGTVSGGGYRLAAPASPAGTGTPCCCSYLPCVLRNYHP